MINMEKLQQQFNFSTSQYNFYLESLRDLGILYLANNDTFFIFYDDDQEDPKFLLVFDHYLGWSNGMIALLQALNIEAEVV